jgi:hypothetical protein
MPRLLAEVIAGVVADHHSRMRIVGEIPSLADLPRKVARLRADIVILRSAEPKAPEPARAVLHDCPHARVLAITSDGKLGFMWELLPRCIPLGEVSPGVIVSAILAPPPGQPAA